MGFNAYKLVKVTIEIHKTLLKS